MTFKLSLNQKSFLAFAIAVLLLTRFDYIVNVILYKFSLKFSIGWWYEWLAVYLIAYQVIIALIIWKNRNKWLLAIFEAFVLTGGQDIVFFMWDGYAPSSKFWLPSWDWMPHVQVFGNWNAGIQIATTIAALLFVGNVYFVVTVNNRVKKLGK